MKSNFINLENRPRLLKAVTGLGHKEFSVLKTPFSKEWDSFNRKNTLEGKTRQRGTHKASQK